MKVYEVLFNEDEDKGLYGISVVGNPAMESSFIALKKQSPIQLAEVDRKERTLLGVVLIPDKEIYRNIDGEEFYIRFPKATIKAAAHAFLKNGYQNNSALEHDVQLNGMSVVEAWIVKDPEMDTANAYGLPKSDIVEGAFVVKMKCDNEEIYNKALNGEITGFSIDGLFSLKQLKLNKNEEVMDKKSIIEAVKEALNLSKKEELKFGQLKLKDGKTVLEFEGDNPEVGKPIFILSDDKQERIAAPQGEHELENGEVLMVDKNGLVAEEVDNKELVAEMTAAFKEIKKEIETEFDAKLQKVVDSHKAELDKKDEEIKALEAKLEETPADDKIVKVEAKIEEPKTARERLYNALLN